MAAIFEKGFDTVLETHESWWNSELSRPLIPVVLTGHNPGRSEPRYPYLWQQSFADLNITPKEFIDSVDYNMSMMEFIGDAFPHLNGMYSGPGITAAFLGAEIMCSSEGRIWFSPKGKKDIREMHFEYDPNNIWLQRVKEIMREGYARWGNDVLIGLPDLGGVMDTLAVFRSSEGLLYDLYDYPYEVKRVTREIAELWHKYFNELSEYIPRKNGYSDWSNILSTKSAYMTQCDFSYMISTSMFDDFVKPELSETYNRLERGYYHLDGVGSAKHIDSLLEIENLKLVQWVPGDGATDKNLWIDLYRKILSSGKHLQIVYDTNSNSLEQLDHVLRLCDNTKVIFGRITLDKSQRNQALEILSRYHVV